MVFKKWPSGSLTICQQLSVVKYSFLHKPVCVHACFRVCMYVYVLCVQWCTQKISRRNKSNSFMVSRQSHPTHTYTKPRYEKLSDLAEPPLWQQQPGVNLPSLVTWFGWHNESDPEDVDSLTGAQPVYRCWAKVIRESPVTWCFVPPSQPRD